MTSRRAGGHAVGEFLHGDLFGQNDVTHDFHLIGAQPLQFRLAAFAFALAAHRGERADAFVLALDRRLNVDAAGTPAVVGGGLARGDDRGLRAVRAPPGPVRRTGREWLSSSSAAAQAQGFGRRGRRGRRGGGAGTAARVLARSGGDGTAGRSLMRGVRRRPTRPRRAARTRHRPGRHPAGGRPPREDRAWAPPDWTAPWAASAHRRRSPRPPGRRRHGRRRSRPPPVRRLRLCGGEVLGFRGTARFFLAPAGFLGGGEDRDLLLLAPFRFAPGGFLLLLDQRTLAGGQLGRGQRAGGAGGRTTAALRARAARRTGAATRHRRRRGCARGALLTHLDLHHLGAAMAEALPYRARIDRTADLEPCCRPQRKPTLARVLILAFAHHPACRAMPVRLSASPAPVPPSRPSCRRPSCRWPSIPWRARGSGGRTHLPGHAPVLRFAAVGAASPASRSASIRSAASLPGAIATCTA